MQTKLPLAKALQLLMLFTILHIYAFSQKTWQGAGRGATVATVANKVFNTSANWVGGTPTSTDDAVMTFTSSLTTENPEITLNANITVKSLIIEMSATGSSDNNIIVNTNGFTLTILGALSVLQNSVVLSPSLNTRTIYLKAAGSGGITAGSISLASTANTNNSSQKSSNIILVAAPSGTIRSLGNLNITNTGTITGSSVSQVIIGNFGTVLIDGTTTVSSNNANVNSSIYTGLNCTTTLTGKATISNTGNGITFMRAGDNYNPTNNSFTAGFNAGTMRFLGDVVFGLHAQSLSSGLASFTMDATSAQTLTNNNTSSGSTALALSNLTVGSTNNPTVTLAGNSFSLGTTLDQGKLVINGSSVLDVATFQITSGGSGTYALNGTARLKVGGANNYPTGFASYTNAATSTTEYNGSVDQAISAIPGTATGYGNLVISGSGTNTLGGNVGVQKNLTINSFSYLNIANFTLNNTTGSGIFFIDAVGQLDLTGTNNFPSNYSTTTLNATSLVGYYGPGPQAVSTQAYGGLLIGGGSLTQTVNITSAITVASNLYLNSFGHVNISSTGSVTGLSGSDFTLDGYLYLGGANNFPTGFATFPIDPASTVNYNGAIAQTVKTGVTYGNLKFTNTSGGLTYASGIPTVSTIGTFSSGILNNRTAGVSAPITFDATGTIISPSATSFVNGYVKKITPASGFVLPLGQTTYMPVTFAAASTGTVTGAWLDAGAPATATAGANLYNLQAGYYDFVSATAASSITLTLPAGTPAGSRFIGYNGSTYADLGLTTATVTLPVAATYKVYIAQQAVVLVNAKAILQGAWGGSIMSTTLNSLHLIPGTQPYSGAPFSYAGSETTNTTFLNANPTIVDWVLVELRDATTPSVIVKQRAAFVGSNGVLLDTNGTVGVKFYNVASANYYISIRHRNHLGIRSTAAQAINSTSAQYDFTTAAAQANGTNAMINASGVYCMWGGNTEYTVNGSGLQVINYSIAASDVDYTRTLVTSASGNTLHNAGFAGPSVTGVYSVYDCNLDGNIRYSVSPSDVDLIRTNVTNVPGNTLHNTGYASLTEKLP